MMAIEHLAVAVRQSQEAYPRAPVQEPKRKERMVREYLPSRRVGRIGEGRSTLRAGCWPTNGYLIEYDSAEHKIWS